MSWAPLDGGYALAMNRDERRTRPPGLPPEQVTLQRQTVLLPNDPEGGGSWIAVNQTGMTLALLNRYEETPYDSGETYTSRGLLVRTLAPAAGPPDIAARLAGMNLSTYRPFTLVSLAKGGTPHLFEWDGRRLEEATTSDPGLVRASSGSDQAEAERVRGELFRGAARIPGGLTALHLERLHKSHLPEPGPLSICMHRAEAETVSLSLITLSPNEIRFVYIAGSPAESSSRVTRVM